MYRITRLVLLFGLCHYACCYNILAIVSLPLKSHYMAFSELFNELANRGHSVTVLNNFPEETPHPNLNFIQLQQVDTTVSYFPRLDTYENFDSSLLPLYNIYRHVSTAPEIMSFDCKNLLTNAKTQSLKSVKYDVIIVEQFMSDCGLAFAGVISDAPIIGITSHVLLPWTYQRLGLPFNFAADPFYFAMGGPNPTFFNKIKSFLFHTMFNSIGKWYIQRSIYETFQKYLPNEDFDIERIGKERMQMVFSYQHFSLTGARVLSPQVLEIGGLHVKNPKQLPKDIQTFLDQAEHGAVYIGFGSNLKLSTISEAKLKEFLAAFKRIRPMKVLFNWENGTIDDENVLTRKWFPQLDVLCHPKVIAFVSHGGMLGSSEAASCGVPMVVVPFFGDQFGNAAMLKAAGMGTILNFDKLTADTLYSAVKEVTSSSMQKRAKEIAELWHDRPMSALDSAIYWTEYVARHPNAPPSLPSKKSTWFDSLHVDLYAILLMLIVIIAFLIYLILKLSLVIVLFVLRKCLSSKDKVE